MKSLFKVSFKYGAIAGLLGAMAVAGLYYIDRHPFLIGLYYDYRIVLFGVFIFFTLKEIRDYHQSGILFFWQGLFASFLFVATFAVVSSLSVWVFSHIEADFVPSYIRQMTEQLKAIPPETIEKIGKETYERNLSLLPATNASDLALLYFVQSFVIGLFISIILSVILRRQPKT